MDERGDDYKSFSYINQRPQKKKTNIINTKKITFFFENIILNSKKIYKKNTKIILKYPKISHWNVAKYFQIYFEYFTQLYNINITIWYYYKL